MSHPLADLGYSGPAEPRPMLEFGLQLHRQQRLADAERAYGEVLALEPANPDALHLMGMVAFHRRDLDRAIDLISRAIAAAPGSGPMHNNRANVLGAMGRLEEALADYATATALHPAFPEAHIGRGDALARLGRSAEAVESYDRALTLRPSPDVFHRRGDALSAAGRLPQALASYEAALGMQPQHAAAQRGASAALYGLGEFERALAGIDAAIAIDPANPTAHFNRGNTLKMFNRFEEALNSYDVAASIHPTFAVARHNLALCQLHLGQVEAGFATYEVRKQCPTFVDPRYRLDRPWTGAEDLAGRTLFLFPELFQGDLIQFARFATTAERRGAKVRLAAPVAMHRLLRSLSPTLQLLPEDAVPDYDYQAPLLSLPHLLGATLATLADEVPYLHAEPERVARWKARIGEAGFKVGVVWQGSTLPYAIPLQRSFPLAMLQGVAQLPDVRLISLQKVNGLDQLATLPPGMTVETLGDDFDPGPDAFVDTAAAMAACDLVITVDTSVAHLAGALGAPTWVALPYVADWRWLIDRPDSPWYPKSRLFRQRARGDWPSVFHEIEAALRERLAA